MATTNTFREILMTLPGWFYPMNDDLSSFSWSGSCHVVARLVNIYTNLRGESLKLAIRIYLHFKATDALRSNDGCSQAGKDSSYESLTMSQQLNKAHEVVPACNRYALLFHGLAVTHNKSWKILHWRFRKSAHLKLDVLLLWFI
ncbi:uncharacterized protein LOC132067178 [Lycium ferocissimum]|uniref:uncharacterized protein LOC132067178 n=1 Tax=Lycium ferocissimum TaxID=112874 RepID=UPI0028159240|nr:uncharacterized protein LOC132067178 [Lycium ferocissimum]